MRLLSLFTIALLAAPVHGQFTTVINFPADELPETITSSTQLNFFGSGNLNRYRYLDLGWRDGLTTNVELNVFDGVFATRVGVYATNRVALEGGALRGLALFGGSASISGGSVSSVRTYENSSLDIAGGLIESLEVRGDSSLDFSGGRVDQSVILYENSTAVVSGGSVASTITGGRGGAPGSSLEILGGEFLVNGNSIAGLEQTGNSRSIDLADVQVLSGTLTDGTPFAISTASTDLLSSFLGTTVTLTVNDVPAAVPLLLQIPDDPVPSGVRSGQTIVVEGPDVLPVIPVELRTPFFNQRRSASAWTLPRNFQAGPGSTVHINSGFVDSGLTAVGASINIAGGSVSSDFRAFAQSDLVISGGAFSGILASDSKVRIEDGRFYGTVSLQRGSTAVVSGGQLASIAVGSDSSLRLEGGQMEILQASAGSEVDIFAGVDAAAIRVGPDATVRMSGGNSRSVRVQSDGQFEVSGSYFGAAGAEAGGQFQIAGGEYLLNGERVSGLDDVGANRTIDLQPLDILSGVLSDGRAFIFSEQDSDLFADGTLNLTTTVIPGAGPKTLSVPGDEAPTDLRTGQKLELSVGGTIAENFHATWGSQVTMSGGHIGDGFEAAGADISIAGGTVGNLQAFRDTALTVSGGSVGSVALYNGSAAQIVETGEVSSITVTPNSTLTLADQSVVNSLHIHGGEVEIAGNATVGSLYTPGGKLLVTGGNLTGRIEFADGADVDVSGGSISDSLRVLSGSNLNFIGGDFLLNGEPIAGLASEGDTVEIPINNWGNYGVLNGVLADGTPIVLARGENSIFTSIYLTAAELPAVEPASFVVTEASTLLGIREGQSLTLKETGSIRENFTAGVGSSVSIEGGHVGNNFEAIGATIDITGGSLGSSLGLFDGSVTNISGGSVESTRAHGGSVLNFSGGTINSLIARTGSTVNLSGGRLGPSLSLQSDSQVNIIGGDFFLDGVPIAAAGRGGTPVVIGTYSTLSGVMADATPFAYENISIGSPNTSKAFSLFETSLPQVERGVISALNDEIPMGIRAGQTLVVENGAVVSDLFRAVHGSAVHVEGGSIGDYFTADGAEVVVSGGEIGNYFYASGGSRVTITGGSIGGRFFVSSGSMATIEGEANVGSLYVSNDATVSMHGGVVTGRVSVEDGGELNLYGGTLPDSIHARRGGRINLFGTHFLLERDDITDSLALNEPFVIADRGTFFGLHGTLADGSGFRFDLDERYSSLGDWFESGSSITITLVAAIPEPSTMLLLVLACLNIAGKHSYRQ